MHTTSYLLAAGLAVQQAAATFNWLGAGFFNCPANTPQVCNPSQGKGFDWSGLDFGDFSSYGDFDFSGFKCSKSFGGAGGLYNRDIYPRTGGFQSKCITGKLSSTPKFGCKKDSSFSVGSYQVTVDRDTDVEMEYDMGEGKTCKHVTKCSKGQTTIENKQCGGAKGVTFKPHKGSDCNFGVHSMSFHCGPASSTIPYIPRTSSTVQTSGTYAVTSVTTSSAADTTVTSVPETTSTVVLTESSSAPVTTSAPVTSAPVTSTATPSAPLTTYNSIPVVSNSSSSSIPTTPYITQSTSTVFTTSLITVTSCAPTVPDCPADSTTVVTSTIAISTTICPVTVTPGPSPSGPVVVPSPSAPIVSTLSTAVVTTPSQPSSSTPAGPIVPVNCPQVLAKCLSSWMWSVPCKDNTDASCFCKASDYTSNVQGCLSAYAKDDAELKMASCCLQGICASDAGSNPGLLTGAPIDLGSCPMDTNVPSTTISVSTVISSTTINTIVTVPQIGFTTDTSAATPSVGVIPSVPSEVPAQPTSPANPGSSDSQSSGVYGTTGLVPTASSTGIPISNGAGGMVVPGVAAFAGLIAAFLAL